MKKFTLISLITAGVMFVLGWGLLITGGVMGGVSLIKEFVTGNVFSLLGDLHGILDGFSEEFIPEEVNIDYNAAYPILEGGGVTNLQVCGRDEVTDMKIYIMSGDLDVQNSGTDDFGVDWEGVGKFQYYVEDGTLYVISTENFGDTTVYVPEDMVYESCTLAAAAGDVFIEEMKAEEVSVYVGMSDVDIEMLETQNLILEAGKSDLQITEGNVGELTLTYDTSNIWYFGSISGNVEVTGSMGNLEMALWGDSDQYNYFIHSTLGSIDIPGYHVVGLTQNKNINNNAGKDMTITSSMGNIGLEFMDK